MRTTVVNIKDPHDVYVGRAAGPAGVWGNPYVVGRHGTREEVIALFREYLARSPELVAMVRTQLRGKRLACFCAPLPCHADVLAEVADSDGCIA